MTRKGENHTEETKRKISETKRHEKGRALLVPQLCACGCGEYAKVDERRNRVSKYIAGHNGRVAHGMKGKSHTPEVRAKLASYTGENASSYKHGLSNTPTYKTWVGMIGRCEDPRNASYERYGARGVTVCPRWKESFENFIADMGMRPHDRTLDRIDGGGDYELGNCRWATPKEQAANRRPRGSAR